MPERQDCLSYGVGVGSELPTIFGAPILPYGRELVKGYWQLRCQLDKTPDKLACQNLIVQL